MSITIILHLYDLLSVASYNLIHFVLHKDLVIQYELLIRRHIFLMVNGVSSALHDIPPTLPQTQCASLAMSACVEDVLANFNHTSCQSVATPLDPNIKLDKTGSPQTPKDNSLRLKFTIHLSVLLLTFQIWHFQSTENSWEWTSALHSRDI
jgi:hypothetical protein